MGAGCCDGYGSLARLGLAQFTPEMCSRVTGTVPLNLAPPPQAKTAATSLITKLTCCYRRYSFDTVGGGIRHPVVCSTTRLLAWLFPQLQNRSLFLYLFDKRGSGGVE